VLRPGEGERVAVGPAEAVLKAVRETSGETFSLSETTIPPGFPGPVAHLHRHLHDAFYVLEGTLTLRVGEELVEASAGTFALIPPGVVHTFSNTSDAPVRFLNLNTPGGWENYLRELAAAMPAAGPPDPARMAEIAQRYDFEPAEPPA
jgi:quercetin dioxygenase-like cupin family protein